MRHLRSDYDSIQPADGQTSFAEDEPVFVLRARDMVAPGIVALWADRVEAMGGDPVTSERVRAWADEMAEWGLAHGAKLPDTPAELLR